MTTLALDPDHLTFLRRQALADAAGSEWALALCAAHPQVHGRYNLPAFALAVHVPTVPGWLYLAARFGHVVRVPRRARRFTAEAVGVLRRALAAAGDTTRPALARWLEQLGALEAS